MNDLISVIWYRQVSLISLVTSPGGYHINCMFDKSSDDAAHGGHGVTALPFLPPQCLLTAKTVNAIVIHRLHGTLFHARGIFGRSFYTKQRKDENTK